MENRNNLPKGYMGRVLHIDLSKRTFEFKPLDTGITDRFFGGRGLGIAFLYKHFEKLEKEGMYDNPFKEVDPFSEDNAIVISTSPPTGTGMPGSGRFHMNFKSPLTNGIGSSNSGGFWGVKLKQTGTDSVFITGAADRPTYLVLEKERVTFHDATQFSKATTEEMNDIISEKLPKGSKVLSIGPAGKNRNRFSAVINEKGRALGRNGGGAVWGSKNLYAIAVAPDPKIKIPVAKPDWLKITNREGATFKAKIKLDVGKLTRAEKHYGFLSSMGSLGLAGMVHNYGQLLHNNMLNTYHRPEDMQKITGETLRNYESFAPPHEETIKVKKGTCFYCPVACKRETAVFSPEGTLIDSGEGPEFETVALLGANLSIYDLPRITKANYKANRYGMDTISLGSTIAAFFELYQLVNEKKQRGENEEQFMKDCGSFVKTVGEPGFGKKELLLPLIEWIGERKEIGDQLAEGSYRFCEKYGHPELSMTIKGQELPAYDPRTSFSQALGYEMSNRGGCHLEGGYTAAQDYCAGYGEWPGDRIEGTPLILKNATFRHTVYDTIGSCVYTSFSISLDEYAHLVNAVTGLDLNAGLLQRLGHRVFTLERMFNIKAGKTMKDDWLPERFFNTPITLRDKELVCDKQAFQKMHIEYYHALGWDDTGIPTQDCISKLELDDMAFMKEGVFSS